MQTRNSLEDVAKEENWIAFGDALGHAMENPGAFGLRSPSEVLQSVAKIRGKRAHSLKNAVDASKWLKNNNPEMFSARPKWLGMTLIMFLMKIHDLDPALAESVGQKVYSGQSGQIELKKEYDALRQKLAESSSSGASPNLSAPQRAQLFNDTVQKYLEEFGAEFFKAGPITVRPGKIIEPVSPDIVATLPSGEQIAIEVKPHRDRVDRHQIINNLGRLALLQKLLPEILMIVPEGSAYDLKKMADLRDKLSLKGISFATLPELGAERVSDLKVHQQPETEAKE